MVIQCVEGGEELLHNHTFLRWAVFDNIHSVFVSGALVGTDFGAELEVSGSTENLLHRKQAEGVVENNRKKAPADCTLSLELAGHMQVYFDNFAGGC